LAHHSRNRRHGCAGHTEKPSGESAGEKNRKALEQTISVDFTEQALQVRARPARRADQAEILSWIAPA